MQCVQFYCAMAFGMGVEDYHGDAFGIVFTLPTLRACSADGVSSGRARPNMPATVTRCPMLESPQSPSLYTMHPLFSLVGIHLARRAPVYDRIRAESRDSDEACWR